MSQAHYSIKAVARRTGLSAHVIRVWERRYGAVIPARTETNRRLYSETDVERLTILRQATLAGHSIGNVAKLASDDLARIAAVAGPAVATGQRSSVSPAEGILSSALEAVKAQDPRGVEGALGRGSVKLGTHGLLEQVVAPLAQRIGELWRDGTLSAAHEHMATQVIRTFLGTTSRPYALNGSMPAIVVATPSGQLHELGAVMAAAAANDLGWRVVYLGASLPPAEIAGAAVRDNARVVALSMIYPEDDPNLPGELNALRSFLPPSIAIVAGGRAADGYDSSLKSIGAFRVENLKAFCTLLDGFRRQAA